ncbi:TIGR03759 family integrating conjugative element protein [Pseudomonas cichorii]|nr:TIGR03759 family integrating conjugative element protein [Pseudomonas cichorii]MBX8508959.1 TIGR03759 family integrating conjugative element protein [Pseudomonas cichorii]MBX8524522.1 TIGR03759 family integrating conjugative element protein [Pseudomonas cichorii]
MRVFIYCQLMLIALLSPAVNAQSEMARSDSRITDTQASESETSNLDKAAKWGLNETEWARFLELMQGPLGLHSPNLDPLSALGIEARNEADRTRYAELQVQMETARITKLLAYQNAYDQAYKRLYPDVVPIHLIGTQPSVSPVETATRPAVFVTGDCNACDALIKRMQKQNQSFDIYLIDSRGNDDRIRAWARKSGVDPEKVRNRQVTLNHDAGRWQKLGGKGEFPAVLKQQNGKWVRQ